MTSPSYNPIDLSTPVSQTPIPADKLVLLLREAAGKIYPDSERANSRALRVRYNALLFTVKAFEAFLKGDNILEACVDEDLVGQFEAHALKAGTPKSYIRNHRHAIRQLINRLPQSHVQRELETVAAVHRVDRYAHLTPQTQEALQDFLRNGKRLKRKTTHLTPELSNELLAEELRKSIVNSTMTFLNAINATDILAITEDDVTECVELYASTGKEDTAKNLFDFIKPLFSNLRANGLISTNPLKNIPRVPSSVNLDFVGQEEINILADLTTVDMDDFKDVRGRLLSFVLNYAYALRNREASLVSCADFHGSELYLPKNIQKVKKDTLPLYSYLPEITQKLMKRYLELRAQKSPATDILMVSIDGRPLGAYGCRAAVKEHCDKLGLKTYEGNPVNPHRLRHSFGTLNIDPLGLELSLGEISSQFRHSSILTTCDIYIAKNPLYKKRGYERRMQKINGILQSQSVAAAPIPPPSLTPVLNIDDGLITENEVIRRVRSLGLNYRALREYALEIGKAQKQGRGYMYSSSLISDLASNYFTRAEAIDLLKYAPSTFYDWTKRDGIEFIQIGQVSLFRKNIILEKRRSA